MVYFTINPITGKFDELNSSPAGTIVGPGSSTVGDIVTWGDTTGTSLVDSGESFSTDGTFAANSDALIPTQKATKTYVDAKTSGITFELPAYAATTGALTATYANGASGVGATLTNAAAMAAFSTDGVSPPLNSRILVKNQGTTFQNGMYTLTTVGSGAVNWVLTRATDFDAPSEIIPGSTFIVLNGTTLTGSAWVETATVTAVGTDPITFAEYIYPPSFFLQVANNLSDVANASTSRTNLGVAIGVDVQAYSAQLDSIAAIGDGIPAHTAANTFTARTITGTANQVDIANGNGVAGNPTASIPSTFVAPGTVTSTGIFTASSGQVAKSTVPGAYPYNVLTSDYIIYVDTSSARTIRLPDAPTLDSIWIIKDDVGSAASNNITLTTVGGAVTIDGATSQTMATNWQSISVAFNGTSYRII